MSQQPPSPVHGRGPGARKIMYITQMNASISTPCMTKATARSTGFMYRDPSLLNRFSLTSGE